MGLNLPWVLGDRVNEDGGPNPVGNFQEINTGNHGSAIRVVVRITDEDADLPSGVAAVQLVLAAPDLLNAVREQHNIIDTLLARLITADPTFRPTKSDIWPRIAAVGYVQLIAKATGAA